MKKIAFWLLVSLLITGIGSWFVIANVNEKAAELSIPFPEGSNLRFIKNDGQWPEEIQYRVKLNGGEVLFRRGEVTWNFFHIPSDLHPHPESHEDTLIHGHVFRMVFNGGQVDTKILPDHEFETYHNYFYGDDPAKWAGKVPLYGIITYQDIYPGIDLRFYGKGNELKYDFIVDAGVDPGQIEVLYQGLDDIFLEGTELHLLTSIREVVEQKPFAYQGSGEDITEVYCGYQLTGNKLSYTLAHYDQSEKLVIDPSMIFSTYTGSTSDNWGFTATYDEDGNAYAGE